MKGETDPLGQADVLQSLLSYRGEGISYRAGGAALLLYVSASALLATSAWPPSEAPMEQPVELVMEGTPDLPAQSAVEAPPPNEPERAQPVPEEPPVKEARVQEQPVQEQPPQEKLPQEVLTPVPEQEPPPRAAEPEAVAPVEPPKPAVPETPAKPVMKSKPKTKEKVPDTKARLAGPTRALAPAAPARGGSSPASNALASGYANLVHARIARSAAFPQAARARGETGRVTYRIVIAPSGALISKSVSSSGNAEFDRAAAEALSRAAPFPPSGVNKPVALSGAIAFHLR